MNLTSWSGQARDILTRTEVPKWVRVLICVVVELLWLAWFGGVFGF